MPKLKNILLVEDDISTREGFKVLIDHNFKDVQVDACVNGKDALDIIKSNQYDLIIMDVGLPDVDGIKVTKEIKKQNPSQKVIACSGHDDCVFKYVPKDLFDNRCSKPFEVSKLIAQIEQLGFNVNH